MGLNLSRLNDVRSAKLLESALFFTKFLSDARTIPDIERELQDIASRCNIGPDVLNAALTELVKQDRGTEESARFLLAAGVAVGLEKEVGTALEGAGKKQGVGLVEIGLVSTAIVAGLLLLRDRLKTPVTTVEIDSDAGEIRIRIEGTVSSYKPPENILALVRQLLRPSTQSGAGTVPNGNETVAAILERLDRIVLSDCVVVGKYLRYDSMIRNNLKDWVRRIQGPLLVKTSARENYLIWAAPGSGKTYLIQQIAEQLKGKLGDNLKYIECNLAKDGREQFVSTVDSLESYTQPVLCLLDEIDARAGEEWPYEACFPKLDLNGESDRQIVIVLIGSTPTSMQSMIEAIKQRRKGPDLLDRILRDQKCFDIPRPTLEDGAAMVVGEIAALLGERVRAVEKLALFYVLCNETLRGSPRQLSEFIKAAATRFQEGEERLRFHHLFLPEDDDKRFDFRKANEELLKGLNNVDVQIAR